MTKHGQGDAGMDAVTTGTLLGGRVNYRQFTAGHRSGFEPVLLASAVAAKPGDLVMEAGTGAGAALLCLGSRVPGITGIGVEIDAALAQLALKNFRNNGLADLSVVQSDVASLPFGAVFDYVIANPPWRHDTGTASPDGKRALAHQGPPALLGVWLAALVKTVKPRGTIVVIIPASNLACAGEVLNAAGCGGITVFPLWPRAGEPAKQVIISARRAVSSPGALLPGLILHQASGLTDAAEAVLRRGAQLIPVVSNTA